ncbi:MAG: hypothetical protein ACLUVG_20785 [Phocaeicola vulgatus]
MDELEQRNPFKMLVEKKQELIAAERELAEAERIFNLVNKGGKSLVVPVLMTKPIK